MKGRRALSEGKIHQAMISPGGEEAEEEQAERAGVQRNNGESGGSWRTLTECLSMFVFQAFKHPQQMCLNETGRQPPQKESKTFSWVWRSPRCTCVGSKSNLNLHPPPPG